MKLFYKLQENSIPIEIHAQKLSEWLMSRKHCKKDWHSHIQPIREKINAAIQDMPENQEIVQLLSGTCKLTLSK